MPISEPMVSPIPGGYEFGYLQGMEDGVVVQLRGLSKGKGNALAATSSMQPANPMPRTSPT